MKSILPPIDTIEKTDTFEKYEILKSNISLFENAAKEIISQNNFPEEHLILFSEGTNIVFAHGQNQVIKLYPPFHQKQFENELAVIEFLQNKLSIRTPLLKAHGEMNQWPYMIMSQLHGTLLETLWDKMEYDNKIIIMKELGELIREVHSLPINKLKNINCQWNNFIEKQILQCEEHHRSRKLSEQLIKQIPEYLKPIINSISHIEKPVLLTGEYTPMNILVEKKSDTWHISGLFDFGDCMLGLAEYDLLGPGAFLIQGDKNLLKEFLIAYGYSLNELTSTLSHKLTALMLLHQCSNLNIQIRIPDWKNKISNLKELEDLVWGMKEDSSIEKYR